MSGGYLWWNRIGNSIRFLDQVTDLLRDGRSAVLQVPGALPWRREFCDGVDLRRGTFGGERQLVRLGWTENADPGETVLQELCPPRVRADYWPGQTCAEYLGGRENILLHDYYVWVEDIHTKADIAQWMEFVTAYDQAARGLPKRAVFLLEYDGPAVEVTELARVVYAVERYDCRVFCLETAAALGNTPSREYQAELALAIGGEPELCQGLLEQGTALLSDPVGATQQVLQTRCTSYGRAFPSMSDQQIERAVWNAAIVLLFPILEQYRADFIEANWDELNHHLPITNSNGDRVTDPRDLEIGSIQFIVSNSKTGFSPEAVETIRLCRKARNNLAHNKRISYGDVQKLLELQ